MITITWSITARWGRLKMAFQKFALLSRTVVFNMDDRNTVDVVNSIDRPVFSFGIK